MPLRGPRRSKQPLKAESTNSAFINLRINTSLTKNYRPGFLTTERDLYVNEWSAYWALKWGDLLLNNRNKAGTGGMWAFSNWMRKSLRENMPADQFVREIITAQGSTLENGPQSRISLRYCTVPMVS